MDRNTDYRELCWKQAARAHLLAREAQKRRRARSGVHKDVGLCLDDVLDLGMRVPLCFDPFETSVQAIQEVRHRVLEEVILPVVAQVDRAGGLSQEARALLEPMLAGEVGGWGLACFGAGLEIGLENLLWSDGYRLVGAFSRVYVQANVHPVRVLAERGVLSETEAASHQSHMMDRILFWGYATMKWGVEVCETVERKSDEFLKAMEEVEKIEWG